MDGIISLEKAQFFIRGKAGISKIERDLNKRREKLEKLMQTGPFWRSMDKIAYILGTILIMLFSFLLGRYPFSHIFTYSSVLISFLVFVRVFQYISTRLHMYLIDFCYFANATIIYFTLFSKKDQNLFICCFLFANGPLAAAIAAFRNSLVYHKLDYLTSLFIHAFPMVLMTHCRWFVQFE